MPSFADPRASRRILILGSYAYTLNESGGLLASPLNADGSFSTRDANWTPLDGEDFGGDDDVALYELRAHEAVNRALRVAADSARVHGEQQKVWVIDQMVRALLTTGPDYDAWVYLRADEDDPVPWDAGIAP